MSSTEIERLRERRFRAVLASIRKLTREARRPPTIREVADDLGRSAGPVHKDLYSLQRDGRVTWEPRKTRTLRVVR